ncbi:MAG: site-specific integrase [Caldimonas sp.]
MPTLPQRTGALPVRELIDLYMAHYAGRDPTRIQRLGWWSKRIGHIELQALSDDEVHAALEELAQQRSRYFAGADVDGKAIYKDKRKAIAPATINRYAASLAAVITWAIKRRIAPKGYAHPCRAVERRTENNEQTRFLSDDERTRLLAACKASPWPRLYGLVLMALTTGARKGELQGLTWADIDRERGLANVGRSKNGDPKLLPLVPAVLDELARFPGAPAERVFPATRRPLEPYAFEQRWKEAMHAARVRGFRFHDLRHSCASMLARSGATLLEIGDLLGHRQLQMTKRYSHLATGHKSALVNRVLGGIK